MAPQIAVRMGEIAVCGSSSSATLIALGLGSCIGVCLYDPASRVAGMAHVVLPDSSSARRQDPAGKYADTALDALVFQMSGAGAIRSRLRAAIVGGAHVFSFGSSDAARRDIGDRNADAVDAHLKRLRIPVSARDCGGTKGRTVQLVQESGLVTVRTVGSAEIELVCLGVTRRRMARAA